MLFPPEPKRIETPKDFVEWDSGSKREEALRFRLLLPRDFVTVEVNSRVPTSPQEKPKGLVEFVDRIALPRMNVLVVASTLDYEVRLRHFYQAWISQLGESLLGWQEVIANSEQPDLLSLRQSETGQEWIVWRTGHKYGLDAGAKLITLEVSCRRDFVEANLAQMHSIVRSFAFHSKPQREHAEAIVEVSLKGPLPWKSSLPASWLESKDEVFDETRSTSCYRRTFGGAQTGVLKVVTAIKELYGDEAEMVSQQLANWSEYGVRSDRVKQKPGPPLGLLESRTGTARFTVEGLQGINDFELTYMVAQSPIVWLYFEMLGVSPKQNYKAWAINRRALRIFGNNFQC